LNQSPVQKGIETAMGCRLRGGVELNQSPVQKGIETDQFCAVVAAPVEPEPRSEGD